jgi:putative sigma-54 modulation protein
MLHAVGDGGTWPLSMSEAVDKITQQAHTLKDKWDTRRRRADGRRSLAAPAVGAREAPSRVVRAARYPIKPMSVEDAALSIDDSGEAFLVFRNAATEGVNIVYRRKDGRVGLIEPE